ncbi:MAG TPA: hypothetical protein VFZ26_11885 [Gemmatimonadales bacterium]
MAEQGTRRLFGLVVAGAALIALPAAAGAQETQRADTSAVRDTAALQDTTEMGRAQIDSAGQDSTHWGYQTDSNPSAQNPPGYRGMERPVNVFPADSGQDTTKGHVEGRVTGAYQDSAWQDTSGAQQNPPGYRGMERPVGGDTSAAGETTQDTSATGEAMQDTSATGEAMQDTSEVGERDTTGSDTTRVGETTPKVPEDSTRRLPAARGDTTGQESGTSYSPDAENGDDASGTSEMSDTTESGTSNP